MRARPRDPQLPQLLRILLLARQLWFVEDRLRNAWPDPEDPLYAEEAAQLRAVLHDALLERYGSAYERALEAARDSRPPHSYGWYITLWPRMLYFAEQGFPGWSESSRVRRRGSSPIGFAVASGPRVPSGANRSVTLMRG